MARQGRAGQDGVYGTYEFDMGEMAPDPTSEAKIDTPQVPSVLYYGPAEPTRTIVGWGHDISDALARSGYPKPGMVCPLLIYHDKHTPSSCSKLMGSHSTNRSGSCWA